jgi:hypothetical protein
VPSDTRETADVVVIVAAAPSGPECDASDTADALPAHRLHQANPDDGMVDVSAAQ